MMKLKAGIIGLGGFSKIILKSLERSRIVEVVAAADIRQEMRLEADETFNISNIYDRAEDIFSDSSIQIVIIATPPFLHAQLGKKAMEAGKHVFFEKPGSITLEQMQELIQLSQKKGVVATVDFVMRRNPLYLILKNLFTTQVFGLPERVFLENYAHDDTLPADHWFWDPDKSGGIWVEHGVHFIDLVQWLIGQPSTVQAIKINRDRYNLIDRVAGTAVHNSTLVSYYHGFTKPEVFEKTNFYAVFERAYVQLNGWIPIEMEIDALMTSDMGKYLTDDLLKESRRYLCSIDTVLEMRQLKKFGESERNLKGRGKGYFADGRYKLIYRLNRDRWEVYRASVLEGITDLASVLLGKKASPDVTLEDAKKALETALKMEMNTNQEKN